MIFRAQRRLERLPQLLHRAKYAVLGRARLYAQRAPDFFNAHALVMPQDERRALHRTQQIHGGRQQLLQLAAERQAIRCGLIIRHRRRYFLAFFIHRRLLLLAPLARPDQVQRAVGGNPVKPGAEGGAAVEFPDPPVGPQERLLHQVFGILFVACHAKCQTEDTTAMALHQHTKRVGFPGADLCDRRSIALFHPADL